MQHCLPNLQDNVNSLIPLLRSRAEQHEKLKARVVLPVGSATQMSHHGTDAQVQKRRIQSQTGEFLLRHVMIATAFMVNPAFFCFSKVLAGRTPRGQ